MLYFFGSEIWKPSEILYICVTNTINHFLNPKIICDYEQGSIN
ncbi:hypothetical protein LX69_02508 [Breznakibacter xylanolyticus]|uniref:Uncharacterized protein n=1 Tax=Breznakibacter xylanolyticus TaxID=990 RepID=A0A2W7N116_9BACT|nr:hypothetical protein LX69_02508 [Breznakibacter xylanolyticus]